MNTHQFEEIMTAFSTACAYLSEISDNVKSAGEIDGTLDKIYEYVRYAAANNDLLEEIRDSIDDLKDVVVQMESVFDATNENEHAARVQEKYWQRRYAAEAQK